MAPVSAMYLLGLVVDDDVQVEGRMSWLEVDV
jgi:hypothetical protein